MPPSAAGQNIQLRWRFGFDTSVAPVGGGWNVDTISFAGNYTCQAVLTAGGVTIGGRVMTSDGRGLTNARVSISDGMGKTTTVVTGRRGLYAFPDVQTGQTYVISVGSRRFSYQPKVIDVLDNVANLDFSPDE